jgi:hypothetical protein
MILNDKYILDADKNVRPEPDLGKWSKFMEDMENRRIAWDQVAPEIAVSTVFLGLNHGLVPYMGQPGTLILWESMVFGGKMGGEQRRSGGSYEQAEAMHRDLLEEVKKSEGII